MFEGWSSDSGCIGPLDELVEKLEFKCLCMLSLVI